MNSPPFWHHKSGRRRTQCQRHERRHASPHPQDGCPLEGMIVVEEGLMVELVEVEEVVEVEVV